MPDSDSQLSQGTVDFRNEERMAANRTDQIPSRKRTPRDEVWDVLVEHFGSPEMSTERAMFGRVVAELLEGGATAERTEVACRYVVSNFDSPSVNAVPKWYSVANNAKPKLSPQEQTLRALRGKE